MACYAGVETLMEGMVSIDKPSSFGVRLHTVPHRKPQSVFVETTLG